MKRISNKTKIKNGWGVVDPSRPQDYKPWITTRELTAGNGRRHIINDLKYPERPIHLMSDLELDIYLKLRTSEEIVELFEQFPLNPKITKDISLSYGIRHPQIPGTNEMSVMTTDFLAVVEIDGVMQLKAYAVKMKKDLEDERTKEKLFLEMEYWKSFNVPWNVITEDFIE